MADKTRLQAFRKKAKEKRKFTARRSISFLVVICLLVGIINLAVFAQVNEDGSVVEEPAVVEEPVVPDTPAAPPTEEPAEQPAEQPAEEPAEEPVEEPAEEPVEEPAEQPTNAQEALPAESSTVTITYFKPFENNEDAVSVPFGTSESSLDLPKELYVKSTNNEAEPFKLENVKWQCETGYNAEKAGTYNFKAKLPEGFNVFDGVKLPEINVTVQPEKVQKAKVQAAASALEAEEAPIVAEPLASKEIPTVITDVRMTHNSNPVSPTIPEQFANGDSFNMYFDWAVDYSGGDIDILDGDTSTIQLWTPGSLPIDSAAFPVTGNLTDASNNVIGSILLTNGTLTMTFNDKLEGLRGVKGTVSVEASIKYTSSLEPVETIKFYNEEYTFKFSFTPGGTAAAIAKKNTGYTGPVDAPTKLNWQIDVNSGLVPNPSSNVVTDTIANGASDAKHVFDQSSVKVYKLNVNLSTGAVTLGSEVTSGYNVTFPGGVMTVTFADGMLANQAYRITYSTIPQTPDTNTTYKNTAAWAGSDSDATFAKRTSVVNSKTGAYSYGTDGKNAYITWTVKINLYGAPITDPIAISDAIPSDQKLQANSFTLSRGIYNATTGQYDNTETGLSWTPTSSSNNLFAGSITPVKNGSNQYYTYTLTYKTDVVTYNQASYTNTVTINNAPTSGTATPSSYGLPYISKTDGTVATADSTIKWDVTVGSRGSDMTNLIVTDTFTQPTTPAGCSMALINDGGAKAPVIKMGTSPATATTLASSDYTISDVTAAGFKITFKGAAVTIPAGTNIYITYYTEYTIPAQGATGQSGELTSAVTFYNKAIASYTMGGQTRSASSSTTKAVVPLTYIQNGDKKGALANGLFTWTITFNSNKVPLGTGNVTLKDSWTDGQEFVADSLQVTGANIVSGPTPDADGKGFTLTVNNVNNNEVVVTYNAKRVGQPTSAYKNKVVINSGGDNWTPIEGTVTGAETEVLMKDATLGSNKTINWSVTLNKAATRITNAKIVDTLGVGQILDENSVTVTRPIDTQLVKGSDYTVGVVENLDDTTTLTIEFSSGYALDVPHTLSYTSRVDDDTIRKNAQGKYEVKNHIELTGTDITTTYKDVKKDNSWIIVKGQGSGEKVPTYVAKIDAETNAPLAGAVFKLTDTNDNELATGIQTDNTGKAYVGDLKAGTYRLYETTPPPGYDNASPGYKEFTVDSSNTSGITVTFSNNRLYTLQVVKYETGSTNINLAGAQFNVCTNANGSGVVATIITGSGGVGAASKKLTRGTYYLVETKAPTGYDLPTNPITTVYITKDTVNTAGVRIINIANSKTPPPPTPTPTPTTPVTPTPTPTTPVTPTPTPTTPVTPTPTPTTPVTPTPTPTTPVTPTPTPSPAPSPSNTPNIPVVPGVIDPGDPGTPTTPDYDPNDPNFRGIENQTGNLLQDLLNGNVPLGSLTTGAAWSLLNLIMSIIAVFNAIMLFVTLFKRKGQNEDEKDNAENEELYLDKNEGEAEEEEQKETARERLAGLKIPALLTGFIPGILFLILENIRLPVTWITKWTPIIGAFFIIHMALVIIQFAIKKKAEKADQQNQEDSPSDAAAEA